MTGWTVRPAEAREAAALTAFGRRVFAATFAPDNEACQLERYLATEYTLEAQASELADPAIMTLLACDGADTILGFAQLHRGVPPLCVADAEPIELWRFYVDQPWHGQGVASVLMQAVRDTAVDGAARTMWLGVWERNPRAQAFYRTFGFTPVGTRSFVFGTKSQTDQIWMRELH
ncbi:MAG: GNAT family N-acetyltransferase [Acidobacteria bacterium]|nr:GNAT family N-acetyltransferase [Acidobacteriota bacterium]